jgi:hypothetical protein
MTKRSQDDSDLTSASQAWRDRLKLTKPEGENRKNMASLQVQNRFQNTAPGDTARKNRKGYRPG